MQTIEEFLPVIFKVEIKEDNLCCNLFSEKTFSIREVFFQKEEKEKNAASLRLIMKVKILRFQIICCYKAGFINSKF